MIFRTLGAGAGGGLPQWNCGCPRCDAARAGRIAPMTQSSAAVSADGKVWLLLNASPDLRHQMAANAMFHPHGQRDSPLRAVIVTNGDVDHIAGLLTLREKTPFTLYATSATLAVLGANGVFGVLDPDLVRRVPVALDVPFEALPGLEVTPYAVPGKVPLYLEPQDGAVETKAMGEQTVALRIAGGGRVVHYLPGCAALPDTLCDRLAEADLLVFDGTVWADDDMARAGVGEKTGARMGHLAMSGPQGSLARLSGLRGRRVYTHINNTNPVLMPEAPERAEVLAAGWDLAFDGMEIVP